MPSLWQQWSQDASHAFQDFYGSWMLGDDAGQSAKLVLVTREGEEEDGDLYEESPAAAAATTATTASKRNLRRPRNHLHKASAGSSGSSSHNQRRRHNRIRRNGRGTVSKSHTTIEGLGMVFCQINGRAYVQSVLPNSRAEQAGVMPQDCVQYAAILAPEWQHPFGADHYEIQQFALEKEERGQRITFQEFKLLLQTASTATSAFTSTSINPLQTNATSTTTKTTLAPPPQVPSTIQVAGMNPCRTSVHDVDNSDSVDFATNLNAATTTTTATTTAMTATTTASATNSAATADKNHLHNTSTIQSSTKPSTASSSSPPPIMPPVVLVLRRTKQRTPPSLPIWPHYRLDDECDVACQILESLATTATTNDAEEDHVTSDNLNAASTPDTETVEAATIRAMIQTAVGLAFVRTNKVVLGISVHGGGGIVLARLDDGTWSAPAAISVGGVGFGLQLGVEVAQYILILKTKEALHHFQRGGSFTIGAHIGAAVWNHGREAVGAASLSGVFCGTSLNGDVEEDNDNYYGYRTNGQSINGVMIKEDEYHSEPTHIDAAYGTTNASSTTMTSLLAYAKSQGLYIGLSLEGSRIQERKQVNARTYQFDRSRKKKSSFLSSSILSSRSYASSSSITAYEILSGKVAPPPEADRLYQALHQVEYTHELSKLPRPPAGWAGRKSWSATDAPTGTAKGIISEGTVASPSDLLKEFDEKFREFLFGGVEVWRVKGRKREQRTLWLCAPEGSASLQLGFVSKVPNETDIDQEEDPASLSHHRTGSTVSENDRRSVTSEDVTLDSALMDNQSILNASSQGIVRTQVQLSSKNSVHLTDVISMNQNAPEDLILDSPEEYRRVIVLETCWALNDSPSSKENFKLLFVAKSDQEANILMSGIRILLEFETQRCNIRGGVRKDGEARSIGNNSNKSLKHLKRRVEDSDDMSTICESLENQKSWGRVPGRNFLREQAAVSDQGFPHYVLGQLLVRDIAKNVHLPLPLPLCRILLLDSSSPVIYQWEKDRGDQEFEKTPWTFPPATPRERDQYQSEHQLIATGSMCGAHRTISYQRRRHGQLVRLFETQIVDSDDPEKLAFQIHERMPRRGFSIKLKIILRSYNSECEATVLAEIRPVGKNMSNPEAVHKAFLLVLEELRERYGPDGKGLLSGFLDAVNTFKEDDIPPHMNATFSKHGTFLDEKKESDLHSARASSGVTSDNDSNHGKKNDSEDSNVIKLEDMLKANASLGGPDIPEPKFLQDRLTKSSPMDREKYREHYRKQKVPSIPSDTFDAPSSEPVMIEVRPLPKIRLSLMPSPREEDEFDLDEDGNSVPRESSSTKKKRIGGTGKSKTPEKDSPSGKTSRRSWGSKRRSRKALK